MAVKGVNSAPRAPAGADILDLSELRSRSLNGRRTGLRGGQASLEPTNQAKYS